MLLCLIILVNMLGPMSLTNFLSLTLKQLDIKRYVVDVTPIQNKRSNF